MGALNEYLFHASWWVVIALGLGGAGLFYTATRRLDKTLQRVGIALVLIALILAGLRKFFPTDREKMEIRTRDIVAAVDKQDWKSLAGLLDPKTAIGTPTRSIVAGSDSIVAMATSSLDRFGIKSVHITDLSSEQTQTLITISLDVLSTQDVGPITSSWQFDYEQSGDHWILEKMNLVRVGQNSGDEMLNPWAR